MGKGRFLNQKLGKRMSRKSGLLKSHLAAQNKALRKEGASRREKPKPK
jgi:hypothetical protein